MKLHERHKIWYLFTLYEFRSEKSVLMCDSKTWVLHAGILYISLSLPSCEKFEKGLEREQDEYFSLGNHSSILIALSELLFFI